MNHYTNTIFSEWPLKRIMVAGFLVLCLFLNSFVSVNSECSDVLGTSKNCSCSYNGGRQYQLLCPPPKYPNVNHYTLMADVNQNELVKLICYVAKSPADLIVASGLNLGTARVFEVNFCPLPDMSFKDFLASMGIPKLDCYNKDCQLRINLSSNGSTLQTKHFEGLNELKSLDLSSNGFRNLPDDLFIDLENLKTLHLHNNDINIPKGLFKYILKIEILDLGNNKITDLEPGVFRNLTNLRLLNLWNNQLRNLSRGSFSDVPNLETLDLRDNSLTALKPDLFADIRKLKVINLSGNKFSSLPQTLFISNPLIESVQFSNNRETLRMVPSGLLSNFTYLRKIYFHNCNLSSLPEDLLWGSPSITDVTLHKNSLTELGDDFFRDSVELVNVDISENKFTKLSDKLFSTTTKIKKLILHHNHISEVSKALLINLYDLEEIDLSFNKLITIDIDAFAENKLLKIARFSNNFLNFLYNDHDPSVMITIDSFGRRSPFRHCFNMEQLYLANNNITQMFHDWLLYQHLKNLDLRYNKLRYLQGSDVHFLSQHQAEVDFSYNNISVVDFQRIEYLAVNQFEDLYDPTLPDISPRITLIGNPLECNCKNYDLQRYFEGSLHPAVYKLVTIDVNKLTCGGPEILQGIPLSNISSKILTCELHEVIRDKICPKDCNCFYKPEGKGLLIDCIEIGMKNIPENFLLSTLKIYEKKLLPINHTELNLSGNHLQTLPNDLDSGFKYVRKLSLSNNNITEINFQNLSPNITEIDLHNNSLTRLDDTAVKFLTNSTLLQHISLYNNPWICDCQTLALLTFIQNSFDKIEDVNNTLCDDGKRFSELSVGDICPQKTFIAIISVTIAILGILIGFLVALFYRYNQEIKVWLYAHQLLLWFVTEDELDRDKLYDAFISYAHQDEEFIIEHLVPGLENGPPSFKLCLHYRDWIVGDYIPKQIARSVEDSRRTIVVLSKNFLESVWGKMEFRTAHSQALSEGRARVIVILYGDIGPTENLDPELKAYVSMNTYVKWGDPWFWDKLRFALPHPPNASKGIPLFQKNLRQQNRPALNIDKDDLIKGTDPNASPPATTTPPANSFINQIPSFIPNGHPKSSETSNNCAIIQTVNA